MTTPVIELRAQIKEKQRDIAHLEESYKHQKASQEAELCKLEYNLKYILQQRNMSSLKKTLSLIKKYSKNIWKKGDKYLIFIPFILHEGNVIDGNEDIAYIRCSFTQTQMYSQVITCKISEDKYQTWNYYKQCLKAWTKGYRCTKQDREFKNLLTTTKIAISTFKKDDQHIKLLTETIFKDYFENRRKNFTQAKELGII